MYIEPIRMRIPYGKITYVYKKAHMMVVQVILGLKITKLSYIENDML
jgi:hypothetical protein